VVVTVMSPPSAEFLARREVVDGVALALLDGVAVTSVALMKRTRELRYLDRRITIDDEDHSFNIFSVVPPEPGAPLGNPVLQLVSSSPFSQIQKILVGPSQTPALARSFKLGTHRGRKGFSVIFDMKYHDFEFDKQAAAAAPAIGGGVPLPTGISADSLVECLTRRAAIDSMMVPGLDGARRCRCGSPTTPLTTPPRPPDSGQLAAVDGLFLPNCKRYKSRKPSQASLGIRLALSCDVFDEAAVETARGDGGAVVEPQHVAMSSCHGAEPNYSCVC